MAMLVFRLNDTSGQDARLLGRRGDFLLNSGRLVEALDFYEGAFHAATRASDRADQCHQLNNIGALKLGLFRYRDAAGTLLTAHHLALQYGEQVMLGNIDGNLSSVYSQTGDLPAAEQYCREALDAYSRARVSGQRARVLIILAKILARTDLTSSAESYFQEGIQEASRLGQVQTQAYGLGYYGERLMKSGRLGEAEHMLDESRQLCDRHKIPLLDVVLWNQGRLRLHQDQPQAALALIDTELSLARKSPSRIPAWRIYATRAEILLTLRRVKEALTDARNALDLARLVRADVMPDDDSRVGADGYLDDAYSTLIEAANHLYLKNHDPRLVRETFEASEENRARTLHALLPGADDWRKRLPPAYWDKMAELTSQQRKVLMLNPTASDRVAKLHTELSQIEAQTGATSIPAFPVLERVMQTLPAGSALLSFRLGERTSWLWAVSAGTLHLYSLPPRALLCSEIQQFQASIVRNDEAQITKIGQKLYGDLFGSATRTFQNSSRWYVSLDQELYGLSMPALVVGTRGNRPIYLTQKKSLEIISGAQLFQAPERRSLAGGMLLAAGDAVYNRADPRFERQSIVQPARWGMPRLPASGEEVRFAAGLWPMHVLLTGKYLTKRELLRAIDRSPAIIHIASHVIEGKDRWNSGILALSLTASGEPDFLTPEEIVLHPTRCRLVVMTGCASGSAAPLPANGLMGLTRAWLGAGAGVVLATRWPNLDETGDGLIGSFYRNLRWSPDGDIPESLRRAQMEILAGGGWRAEPRYWSSYFLIGNR